MFIAIGLIAAIMSFTTAEATTVTVTPTSGSVAKSIQAELDKSATLGTKSDPYVVNVKAGSYTLEYGLKLYSNVTLNLSGVTFKLSANTDSNMLKVGETSDTKSGYYYQNITVNGGTFDANKNSVTALKVAHAKNVTFNKVTAHNTKNAHLVEVAGTDGFTVDGCKFYNQAQDAKSSSPCPEAIQIDILVQKHMSGYRSEALPMKNVTVQNCTFKNVPRGVGSHTAVLNDWVENVKILNNTFTSCKSAAIQTLYYKNCVIEGNTISSAPRGIIVYTVNTKGVFFASTLAKEGGSSTSISSKYVKPSSNQKIVIRNNKITIKGSDIFADSENEGIMVSGFNFTSALKKSSATDAIPKGNYFASGATIEGNTISTIGHGIRLSDARNCKVLNNKVTYVKGKTGNLYGIQLINAATNNTITGNKIKARTNGIFVTTKSSAKLIEGNTITSAGKYGIAIEKASATTIKSNVIKKAVTNGIYALRSSKVTNITKNTINNVTKGSAINIDLKSTAKKIEGNTIKKAKLSGIFVHKSSKSTLISKNKISGVKKYGIFVEDKSKVSKITRNTINVAKDRAIVVRSGTSKTSGNKTK